MKVNTHQHLNNSPTSRKLKVREDHWKRPDVAKGCVQAHTQLQNFKAQVVEFPELGLIVEDFEHFTEIRFNGAFVLTIDK